MKVKGQRVEDKKKIQTFGEFGKFQNLDVTPGY